MLLLRLSVRVPVLLPVVTPIVRDAPLPVTLPIEPAAVPDSEKFDGAKPVTALDNCNPHSIAVLVHVGLVLPLLRATASGPAMVRQLPAFADWPSGLVSVIVRGPTLAFEATEILTVAEVADVALTLLTVTPVPLMAAASRVRQAPAVVSVSNKPVPVSTTFTLFAPTETDVGAPQAVSVGAGACSRTACTP